MFIYQRVCVLWQNLMSSIGNLWTRPTSSTTWRVLSFLSNLDILCSLGTEYVLGCGEHSNSKRHQNHMELLQLRFCHLKKMTLSVCQSTISTVTQKTSALSHPMPSTKVFSSHCLFKETVDRASEPTSLGICR